MYSGSTAKMPQPICDLGERSDKTHAVYFPAQVKEYVITNLESWNTHWFSNLFSFWNAVFEVKLQRYFFSSFVLAGVTLQRAALCGKSSILQLFKFFIYLKNVDESWENSLSSILIPSLISWRTQSSKDWKRGPICICDNIWVCVDFKIQFVGDFPGGLC